ncbi:MAG: dihydroorotase [Ruminococcaceae bacterium]|nr:dihydroorotase [Oscillospiraceae bacterium]
MDLLLKNAKVYNAGAFSHSDLTLPVATHCEGGSICVSEFHDVAVLPAFADVHVHLREPGFFYKETIASGTASAARGGYSDVCAMPNLNPVPDTLAHLVPQLDAIRDTARIHVHPYGAITMGQQGEVLADLEALAPHVVAFSDDGRGVQSPEMMLRAMEMAKSLGKLIAAHCEDNSLLRGGYIHDGEYARLHGHRGICSESEWGPVARDLELVAKSGCAYHVCHVSTKETVELIRQAKKSGLDVSCETGPHYLLKNDMMLQEHGRFKMNPPIRSEEDRQALLAGILDGTIEMIATDHAPHSVEEKSRGLEKSLMGVVGLETAFPVLYTGLVKPGILSLEKLVELMAINPRKRFNLPFEGGICIWDLEDCYAVDPEEFQTMGRFSPFTGETVFGRCLATVLDGKTVWLEAQRR